MRIGFIGLGNMGSEIARHLVGAGHALSAYARGERSRANAEKLGLKVLASPAEAARASDVVFTMVNAGTDVEDVVLGARGAVHGAAPGSVIVDLSTISPAITRDIGGRLARKGIAMLDAPVSGGIPAAKAAALSIFVGGETAVFEQMRPLLSRFGKSIFYMGAPGAGQVTKLANQIAQLACLEGAAEALLFAREQGVNPAAVREAVMTGYGASRMLDILGKKMVDRDFAAGIVAALHHKDIGVAVDLSRELNLPMPVTTQILKQLNALMAAGYGSQDSSSLLLVLERALAKSRTRQKRPSRKKK